MKTLETIKKLFVASLFVLLISVTSAQSSETNLTNADKAVALITSFETGDPNGISYINSDKYIQHNLDVPDGLSGLVGTLGALPEGSTKAKVVRAFEDNDYVVLHVEYDFFGPKIGFDIFRFEEGLIVEHWDNLQGIVEETASGRSQIDGPTEITDLDKTEENKTLVDNFVSDVLMGNNPDSITDYISPEAYYQHNPLVADGLAGLGAAIQAMADAGTPMVYTEHHATFGKGNFVLVVAEGQALGNHVAFYDLFRVEDGKIIEHWDVVQEIPAQENWQNDNGKFGF